MYNHILACIKVNDNIIEWFQPFNISSDKAMWIFCHEFV